MHIYICMLWGIRNFMRSEFHALLFLNADFFDAVGISCGNEIFIKMRNFMRTEFHANGISCERNLMRTEFDAVLYLIFSVKSITIA